MISVVLLFSAFSAYASENQDSAVYSYDFDLRFHLDAEGFQPRIRSHIRGYAELLDMLSLKGNLTWSAETGSMDLDLSIIPLTNPSAAVSMHFFGIPEHICMSSSLIGNETIWLNNYVLMEFALKSWNNLHIPLQYIALLFPYVTENAAIISAIVMSISTFDFCNNLFPYPYFIVLIEQPKESPIIIVITFYTSKI